MAAVQGREAVVVVIKTRLNQVVRSLLRPSSRTDGLSDRTFCDALASQKINLQNAVDRPSMERVNSKIKAHRQIAPSGSLISPALQALTTAALMLPGVMPAQAADDEVTIQYGHYEEAKRDIYGPVSSNVTTPDFDGIENKKQKFRSQFAPITVDSIHAQAKTTLKDRWRFTANYTEDTWSGATPVATAPSGFGGNQTFVTDANYKHNDAEIGQTLSGASPQLNTLDTAFNAQFKPVLIRREGSDPFTFEDIVVTEIDKQLTHTMTMASPETRKQGDFSLGYEWDEAAVNVGGGISIESDYESRFVNWGGQLDFNNKLTTLNFSQSYTNSTVKAYLDHDSLIYFSTTGYELNGRKANGYVENTGGPVVPQSEGALVNKILHGQREDIGTNFSLTQVMSKSALLEAGAGYTYSSGFLENPYKVTYAFFVDPNSFDDDRGIFSDVATSAFTEQRPNQRNQVNLNLRYVQYVEPLDAAMNLKYNYFIDDWGINAHTFEGKWVQPLPWGVTVTPTIRYYSQSSADFYHPFLVSKNRGVGSVTSEENYRTLVNDYPHFSSDHRLSAFGALSGGVIVSKQFARGLSLEMGFEYYTHQGDLRLGGGGEADFADFSAYSANAALKVDLATLGRGLAYGNDSSHHHHHHHHGPQQPAGLMFGHMLEKAGDWMIGYNYMYSRQAGNLLKGTRTIADSEVILNNTANNPNCAGTKCFVAPSDMTMHMHMFMLMYAPTDWMNVMLMPTFMDMSMNMRSLEGASNPENTGTCPSTTSGTDTDKLVGAACLHTNHEHQTGGIGDTNISAQFKLYGDQINHLHLTLGVSAPTGDIGIKLRPNHGYELGFIHYGMQLGSGTWDFTPSMTYTGHYDNWGWGAQVQGIKRLESQNESGYALGDMFQTTAWGSYQILEWLGGTVRGIYTSQGALQNEYNDHHVPVGTMDEPANHGGRYWDVGLGLTATIPRGDLAGNAVSVEWIQPVQDDVNGIQIEREGALAAKWSYMF
ncbi:DUF3570 domain-containing protein [Methylicorpusculum sp.]|uniref:DUF3570 domain-containing protein n=2 Tax=Methylicorpusculum sp. TaxID=2713644 RepID=UPI002736522C|nr:DUF3570 domain-containing protein [Methylicorpusculum sp.]